jgi:A/G-specific adenine glycosylase
MEANVKRIVARIFAYETPTDEQLWSAATALLDRQNPFHHNQAMMDLGATVCTPKNPACTLCPAQTLCQGKLDPERYPAKKVKKQIPTREVLITVRRNANGELYLTRRADRLLGGLYGFPQTPVETTPHGASIGTVTHVYSHFKLVGHVVLELQPKPANHTDWYSQTEIAALPLSTLDHKVLALVENCNTALKKHADSGRARTKD